MTNFQRKFDLTFAVHNRTIVQMKKIPLTQGKFALVDDADFDWLSQWGWHATTKKNSHIFYASRIERRSGKQGTVLMHREILTLTGAPEVDHRDGDGLNNRRKNLRPATHQQNLANQRIRKGGTSRFKGVCWSERYNKWRVTIKKNYRQLYLGRFSDEIEAARAYDAAALKHFGEFARINFP